MLDRVNPTCLFYKKHKNKESYACTNEKLVIEKEYGFFSFGVIFLRSTHKSALLYPTHS